MEIGATAPSLLLAPGVGEDVAAVPMAGEEVLVLKSDPIAVAIFWRIPASACWMRLRVCA
jgi:hypothetical protein